MKLRHMLIACCVLMPAESILAQTAAATADRISGTWTGYMRPNDVPDASTKGQPITIALKYDGKGVTGTVTGPPQPGEIRTGSFDPQSGALSFAVIVAGEADTFVFDGTVVLGTATGRVRAGTRSGVFLLTKAGGESAAAPQAAGNDVAAAMRAGFGEVSGNVMKAAELVPADKYGYRPTPSVRTFGQQIAHVADAYNYYCARAAGQNVQWSDAIEKGATDKATLAAKLKQATDVCAAAYAGTGQAGQLLGNIGHTSLHYGNIITYMRMLGLVPPSS